MTTVSKMRTYSHSSVWSQYTKSDNVHAGSALCGCFKTASNGTNQHIIMVCCMKHFPLVPFFFPTIAGACYFQFTPYLAVIHPLKREPAGRCDPDEQIIDIYTLLLAEITDRRVRL